MIIEGNQSRYTIGRLMMLKKTNDEISNSGNLRPIVIGSVMVKLIETIALNKTKQVFLKAFSKY
jgi:hypothetical protein